MVPVARSENDEEISQNHERVARVFDVRCCCHTTINEATNDDLAPMVRIACVWGMREVGVSRAKESGEYA